MRALMIAAVLVLTGAVAPALADEDAALSEDELDALSDTWTGRWRGSDHVYDARMRLSVSDSGRIDGTITWTLVESPLSEDAGRIGLTGVEYVRGAYDPGSGMLEFQGHRLDDPDLILGLDSYRLQVSTSLTVMEGATANGGSWQGELRMTR